MSTTSKTLAVTGASGHLGRRVIELLLESKAGRVVGITRHPEKLADLATRGVDVRKADFDDAEALASAFAGVDRALIISTDALDRRAQQQKTAVECAERAGVGHVVYTSIVRAESGLPPAIAPSHYSTEQALAKSGMSWTVLRNSLYTDLFLQSLPYAVSTGQLVAATGDGGAGYVTREDCARAAAAALASSDNSRKTLDITGPAVVTGSELARIASEVTGKPVTFVPISVARQRDGLLAAGMPPFVADLLASFDDAVARNTISIASTALADLTGRPAQSVKDFLTANRALLG